MKNPLTDNDLIVFDGACGTTLQLRDIPDAAWDGHEGCNEYLNLSSPDVIRAMHRAFVAAGAEVLETNTFGATRFVLSEYGLQDRVTEINAAAVAHARAALEGADCGAVAGSVGPGTKLAALGHIGVAELTAAYREQMQALVQAGVDCLIIETCQDPLQIKTAVVTALAVCREAGREVPILVSVTVEQTGTLLAGSDIAAVAVMLEPFPIFSLGLNCATGPAEMESHIRYLAQKWPCRISCIPNQGLPEVVDGRTRYPMSPRDFAAHMLSFVKDYGVSIVGGCCGTTPEHIRALAVALRDVRPAAHGLHLADAGPQGEGAPTGRPTARCSSCCSLSVSV